MVSEPVSKKMVPEKSLGTSIGKNGIGRKSQNRYRKKVSEPVSEKIGTGKKSRNWCRKNLVPEKVSELVSEIFDRIFLQIQCKFIVFIIELFIFVAKIYK